MIFLATVQEQNRFLKLADSIDEKDLDFSKCELCGGIGIYTELTEDDFIVKLCKCDAKLNVLH